VLFPEPRLWMKDSFFWSPLRNPVNITDLSYTVDAVKSIPFNNNNAFTPACCGAECN
jgi:hypothetical protein